MTQTAQIPSSGDLAPTLNLNGYTPLPAGKVATIVTILEMHERPAPLPEREAGAYELHRVAAPDTDWYRALFDAIGRDWLWFSRQSLSDEALAAIITDPAVEIYALSRDGEGDLGLLELDFREAPDVELAFFGVVPTLVGSGAGRFMINRAMEMVWQRAVRRFHVHTCTNDHPAALGFYRKAGFRPVAQAIEVVDDPRLTGLFPAEAAPQLPIIR